MSKPNKHTWQEPKQQDGVEPFNPGLKVNNSLTRSKDLFVAQAGRRVTWYMCGPTVYDSSHMGHARTYLSFDIIRRILEDYFGYNVFLVMNVTDVDDKIILKARQNHLLADFRSKHERVSDELRATLADAWREHIESLEKKAADAAGDATLVGLFKQKVAAARKEADALAKVEAGADASDALARAADALAQYLDRRHGHEEWIDIQRRYREHAERYEREYLEDMAALGVRRPDVMTRVSEYMPEVVSMVARIIERGYAYETNGSVYFDTHAFATANGHAYAKLEPGAVGDLRLLAEGEGALKGGGDRTKTPNDFALWKKSKAGEPSWASPWGQGRPGWHIECSAMAGALIGACMDVHSGGQDLKFPHHDNEMAQAEAAFECPQWVNYFWHTGKLNIEGLKMAKSLKNFVTIREALAESSARQLRLMFLFKRWDGSMNYSRDAVDDAKSKEKTLAEFFLLARNMARTHADAAAVEQRWSAADVALHDALLDVQRRVDEALKDNFDTPSAMLALLDIVRDVNVYVRQASSALACRALLVGKVAVYVTRILRVFGVAHANDDFSYDDVGDTTDLSGVDALGGGGGGGGGGGANDAAAANADSATLAPVLDAFAAYRTQVRDAAIGARKAMAAGGADAAALLATLTSSVLDASDAVRDDALPPLGVRLEDEATFPWKLVDADALMREVAEKKANAAAVAARKKETRLQALRAELVKLRASAVPPADLFRDDAAYSAFDDKGLPLKTADGEPVSKAATKKLTKKLAAHEKAHAAFLDKGGKDEIERLEKEIKGLE